MGAGVGEAAGEAAGDTWMGAGVTEVVGVTLGLVGSKDHLRQESISCECGAFPSQQKSLTSLTSSNEPTSCLWASVSVRGVEC